MRVYLVSNLLQALAQSRNRTWYGKQTCQKTFSEWLWLMVSGIPVTCITMQERHVCICHVKYIIGFADQAVRRLATTLCDYQITCSMGHAVFGTHMGNAAMPNLQTVWFPIQAGLLGSLQAQPQCCGTQHCFAPSRSSHWLTWCATSTGKEGSRRSLNRPRKRRSIWRPPTS